MHSILTSYINKILKVSSCAILMMLLIIGINSAFASAEDEQYVVLISIDGFPAWALWDENIPLPNIRELAKEGVYAQAMIPSTPSVTWPNHTTLVTGVHPEKHGLVFNGVLVRSETGEPFYVDNERDKSEMVAVPTLYDIANEAGLRTADVGWPGTQNAGTFDDSFPGTLDNIHYMTPQLRSELINLNLIPDDQKSIWGLDGYGQVRRDFIWRETARHLIRKRQPNLLLLHLLNVDGTHHGYGEGTVPGHLALSLTDMHIGTIIEELEVAGIREQTSIFLVSDHGFMNVTHHIYPNVILRKNGFLEINEEGEISRARIQIVPTGGTAMVYVTEPSTISEELEKEILSLFQKAEGVERVLEPQDYKSYGLPNPSENQQMGDLVLLAKEGYAFNNSAEGDKLVAPLDQMRGTHGYLSDVSQMETLFIASGFGIKSGIKLGYVDNRSVAPTVSKLLGISMETADGVILEEILK